MSTETPSSSRHGDTDKLSASSLLDQLQEAFPLIAEMADTPQDPQWHAEGSVRVHTEMVIDQARRLLEEHADASGLDPDARCALLFGAALHDIGKCLTTREQLINGELRITSPRHATRGRSYVAPRLPRLGLSPRINDLILTLVGHHHDPRKLLSRSAQPSNYWRFGRMADARLIYLLEIADNHGRHCLTDPHAAFELLELFRLACEEHGIWNNADPYGEWRLFIANEIGAAKSGYVLAEARRWYEKGEISTPHEAIARSHEHRKKISELVLTCGPSGSGKSQWIDLNLPNHQRISLDAIRIELGGRRDRMKHEGQVLQLARERLRECLRNKRDVVWDATNLRESGRAALLGLGHDYHANTRVVALATPPDELHRRNRKRKDSIPTAVIERQLAQLEWPFATESHEVETVYAD